MDEEKRVVAVVRLEMLGGIIILVFVCLSLLSLSSLHKFFIEISGRVSFVFEC